MAREISPLAQSGIDFFDLETAQRAQVEACVQSYSHVPQNIVEKVEKLAYQILEELKHLISESQWDQAAKILSERTFDAAPYSVKFFIHRDRFKPMGRASLQALVYANKTSIPVPSHTLTIDHVSKAVDTLVITLIKAL